MLQRTIAVVFISALITGTTFAGPKLIRQVKPTYPPEAEQAGITGTVRLQATIAPDGRVADLIPLIGGNAMFMQAAVQAVRQWLYEPVSFEGTPVAFMTSIKMDFSLPAAIAIEDDGGFFPGMRLVYRVDPVYPSEAHSGTVSLQAMIGKDGAVQDLRRVDGDSILASAAEEALHQWRFEPLTIAGKPTEALADIVLTFTRK